MSVESETEATLQKHQSDLLKLLSEVSMALAGPEPTRAVTLAAIRWRLARAMRAYQLFKHYRVLDPLIARGDPRQRSLATDMKERCVAIGKDFEAHVLRWSSGSIATEWAAYERDVHQLIGTLRRHNERESCELTLLLSRGPSAKSEGPGSRVSSGQPR